MKIIVDTNILVRFLTKDHDKQFNIAYQLIENSTEIVIPTHVFCELLWVLTSDKAYNKSRTEVLEIFETLAQSKKVLVKEDEVEAGLYMMRGGGDFEDGVIAYTGRSISTGDNAVFVSFDKTAVGLLAEQGFIAIVPS